MKRFAAILFCLLCLVAIGEAATIYGHRIKNGEPQRWLTSATSVEIEVPGHGTVLVFVEGEELFLHANGDSEGGRSLTVHGLVVNQLRVGFSKE